jgi:hypothetical protein
VMGEFKNGKLRSSSGKKVKSRKQAIAIALSEQRRVKKEVEEIAKASFGSRSEAGRYAANIRWQKQGKGAKGSTSTRAPRGGKVGSDKRNNLDELKASLEEARGMLEVEQDLAATGNTRAAENAKVTADRIRGLERDIASMEGGATKAPKAPKASAGVDERTAGMIRDGDLSDLAGMIVRDLRSQGKKMPFGAQPYIDAMRQLSDISQNYGADSGSSIVAYALSNLAQYKGETAKAIKAELKRRLKNSK